MILFSYILHYIISVVFLYFLLFIIIYLLMYTLAIVGVYAYRISGESALGLAYLHNPSSEKHRSSRCPIPRFFIQGSSSSSCNPWPVPWKGLHQKGAAASQQLPLHSRGISLYLFYTLYIGIRSSALLLLPQELPCEPLPFPFRSQPGRRRLLP